MRYYTVIARMLVFVVLVGTVNTSFGQDVLLEAERFDDYGGWVLDQQFMDQMGSSYLLAHGLGNPLADAETAIVFPETGTYKILVRTRDWVATWGAPGTPGRFQVLINGSILGVTFGAEGADWHWQDGGTVEINNLNVTVGLHDLTGFDGRCDAILFTKNLSFNPPNENPDMKLWRRDLLGIPEVPTDAGEFDLVVIGGGIAGTCAAVSAAREGLSVALIQDRPVLGGNNSSEVRVHLGGSTNYEPYPGIGDIVGELDPGYHGNREPAYKYDDAKKLAVVQGEENISLFLNYRGNEVETSQGKITAVIAESTCNGRRLRFTGHCFADCTGCGVIGFLAGADYEITETGHMGRSNLWRVVDTGTATTFPSCPWALDLSTKPFPTSNLGNWFWESGFYHDPFDHNEYIRDWNFRALFGAWDALKNAKGQYPNHKLEWAAYITGKRESRRLLGDIILTESDLHNSIEYNDGCVPTSWTIDVHLPDPAYDDGFEGDEFISKATFVSYPRPYWIPYRCLYSRNIDNLFMAGRNISVTHQALGTVRVMRTTGMMGEIVGMAASLASKYNTTPRDVYTHHLDELQNLMNHIIIADLSWLEKIGPNIALDAEVSVSSNYDPVTYSKEHINDGLFDITDNSLRWLSSSSGMPDYVLFQWDQPHYISAARIVSGWYNGNSTADPVVDFKLQYYDGDTWQDIEGSQVTNNTKIKWVGRFPAVSSEQVRLVVTETPSDISRIWEIEFYHPTSDLNYDGQVDLADVAEFAGQWLCSGPDIESDLDQDQLVDLYDFSIISTFWNWP